MVLNDDLYPLFEPHLLESEIDKLLLKCALPCDSLRHPSTSAFRSPWKIKSEIMSQLRLAFLKEAFMHVSII